ncbi:MAG: methicillin resistance protein [Clostridiales bacterium]|nr:methicillin resistance protein [Clostridiales bacterium]
MNERKLAYRLHCQKEKTIPLFSRDWWMDAVCGEDNWDVLLVERDNEIVASMPYYKKKKFGLTVITQPPLTQTNGIWIKYPPGQKYSSRLSYEKEVMTEIIDQLQALNPDYYSQNFHYSVTNWQPFYWKGFTQTTRYTYVIPDINTINLEELFSEFSRAKRRNIKRAESILDVRMGLGSQEFYNHHKNSLAEQGEIISYSFDTFQRIYNASVQRGYGQTIYAVDENQEIHSALFVVWDENSAYDLISTIDPGFRESGSASLLIQEIIKYVSTKTNHFDFEGSMIEGVANSFRQFATIQKPYYNISYMSRRMKVAYHSKELIKAIFNR